MTRVKHCLPLKYGQKQDKNQKFSSFQHARQYQYFLQVCLVFVWCLRPVLGLTIGPVIDATKLVGRDIAISFFGYFLWKIVTSL